MTTLSEIKQIENTIKADTQQQLKELLAFMILNDEAKAIRESKTMIYYVTKKGEVYSYNKNNKSIKKLSQFITKRYLTVSINRKNERVHRLVAEAFDDDFFKYQQVNHIDKNTLNNHIDNLEMCTLIENIAHQYMSDKLKNWHVSIKDMREAERLATDEKNMLQVLDFHYQMNYLLSDAFDMTEVHNTSEA